MKTKRWVNQPWLSVILAFSWLLLQHSLAPVHLLSAALIGLVIPRLLHDFLPAPATIKFLPLVQLGAIVMWDIVISNVTVAQLVLGPIAKLRPAWVTVPLTLTHPTAISMLASIITTTPGTVSCTIDEQRREILVHALDCADPAQMAADIKQRYEVLLQAVFKDSPHNTGERV